MHKKPVRVTPLSYCMYIRTLLDYCIINCIVHIICRVEILGVKLRMTINIEIKKISGQST